MLPRLMIASPSGRSGKTTIATGLCALLKKRGLTVQPFKKGPDYIDASWLTAASRRACRNLDVFLMGNELLSKCFFEASDDADIAIIEGNMGLYDGIDTSGTGSSASIARFLHCPVILVVNTVRITRSVAAMIQGYRNFEPDTDIAGVILNNVSGMRHAMKLIDAIEKYCGLPVLGVLPRNPVLNINERHLGLTPYIEVGDGSPFIDDIVAFMENHLNVEEILKAAGYTSGSGKSGKRKDECRGKVSPDVKIGIFYDAAFSFYYPENLEALVEAGANLIFINSMKDTALPGIDGLYIGGGFPELYADDLSRNRGLMNNVADAVHNGLPLYAECAGLMYLCEGLRINEKLHPMAGSIQSEIELSKSPQGHGYVEAEVTGCNSFFSEGYRFRGHEFHYSRLANKTKHHFALAISRGQGINGAEDGIVYKNMFASYTHIHARGTPEWAPSFVTVAGRQKQDNCRSDQNHMQRRHYGSNMSGM